MGRADGAGGLRKIGILAVSLPIVLGWFGWSYWLAIPVGFFMFWAAFRHDPQGWHHNAKWAFLTAPLIGLLFMWIGASIRGLLT